MTLISPAKTREAPTSNTFPAGSEEFARGWVSTHHPHRGFFSMKQFLGNAPMGTTWYNHPIRSEHWICIFPIGKMRWTLRFGYEIEHDFEVAQHVSGTHCRQPTTVGVIFSVCAARLQRRQNYSWNHVQIYRYTLLLYWWFVFLLILHFALIHIWIDVSQWLLFVFFPPTAECQSRFRGGFGAAPGRVPHGSPNGEPGRFRQREPGGSGPAFWPCPGGSGMNSGGSGHVAGRQRSGSCTVCFS